MRKVLWLLLLLGLAAPARADIADSGNLTIGGQGVIQGTMTVQGSAFSVGGATFTVAGGSMTLGGILNVAPTGIKWADGTTSTTAASGSGSGSGNYIQVVSSEPAGFWTTTNQIPGDDTIPQSTEGLQIAQVTITPHATTNKLLLQAVVYMSGAANGNMMAAAIFQDSNSDATAVGFADNGSSTRGDTIVVQRIIDAGTTSATTFKLRAGMAASGTATINGEAGGRVYGGALKSGIYVTEYKP